MDTSEMTGLLGFGTLAVALIIALFLFLRFMRRPGNRHPMEGKHERNIDEIRSEDATNRHSSPE